MAPRSRPRKPRLTRMDAAVDAMLPLGFSEEMVRRRVGDLLKEYGGDEGWPFIEADAYRLLIDTFLDEQEEEVNRGKNNAEDYNMSGDKPLQDERAGDYSVASDAGPMELVPTPTYSDVVGAAARTIETEGRNHLLSSQRDGKGWKDIVLDQKCVEEVKVDARGIGDNDSGQGIAFDYTPLQFLPPDSPSPPKQLIENNTVDKGDHDSGEGMELQSTLLQSPPSVIPSLPPPANCLPARGRRKPCYGWICSGDEEEDFVFLTPAIRLPATPRQPENMNGEMAKRRKRKTRWDQRPEDI